MIRRFIHHLLPNDMAIVIAGIAVVLAAWGTAVWTDPPQPNVCPHSRLACVH